MHLAIIDIILLSKAFAVEHNHPSLIWSVNLHIVEHFLGNFCVAEVIEDHSYIVLVFGERCCAELGNFDLLDGCMWCLGHGVFDNKSSFIVISCGHFGVGPTLLVSGCSLPEQFAGPSVDILLTIALKFVKRALFESVTHLGNIFLIIKIILS